MRGATRRSNPESPAQDSGVLRRLRSSQRRGRGDVERAYILILAPAFASELCSSSALDRMRAQGRPGIDRYPWSACSKKARGRTTGQPNNRPSLHDGVTAYTSSPRGPAFLPPCRDNARGALRSASAPGCQDHTTSPCASCCSSARLLTLQPDTPTASRAQRP